MPNDKKAPSPLKCLLPSRRWIFILVIFTKLFKLCSFIRSFYWSEDIDFVPPQRFFPSTVKSANSKPIAADQPFINSQVRPWMKGAKRPAYSLNRRDINISPELEKTCTVACQSIGKSECTQLTKPEPFISACLNDCRLSGTYVVIILFKIMIFNLKKKKKMYKRLAFVDSHRQSYARDCLSSVNSIKANTGSDDTSSKKRRDTGDNNDATWKLKLANGKQLSLDGLEQLALKVSVKAGLNENKCINSCSNHGECEDHGCRCVKGFTGYDCSIAI